MIGRMSGTCKILATLLYGVIFIFTLARRSSADIDVAAVLFVVATGLSFLASAISRRSGGIDYLFWFFLLFFVAIPAQVQISVGIFPFDIFVVSDHVALAYALLALSMLCYLVGQSAALHKPRIRTVQESPNQWTAGTLYTRWAWGTAFFATIFAVVAGPENLFVVRTGKKEAGFDAGIIEQLLFISRSLALLALVMMLELSRFAEFSRLRRKNFVAAVLFLPIFVVINFPPAQPRFVLYGTIISLGACPT